MVIPSDESQVSYGRTPPARNAFAITPNDTNLLANLTRGIYVGGDGNIVLFMADDESSVTFVGVLAGTLLPLRVARVLSTGTTATNLVGVY